MVNILDVAAMQPWRGYLDHCTAKAGLLMATRVLAVELAPAVRVNGVAPGAVAWPEEDPRYAEGSEIRARILRAIPLGRIGTPDDVAETVLFLARSSFISGQVIAVDGGRDGRWWRRRRGEHQRPGRPPGPPARDLLSIAAFHHGPPNRRRVFRLQPAPRAAPEPRHHRERSPAGDGPPAGGHSVDERGVERAIRKLRRLMASEGVLREIKRRRHYEKPSVKMQAQAP